MSPTTPAGAQPARPYTHAEYVPEVLRTMGDWATDPTKGLLGCALGLCGEAAELDRAIGAAHGGAYGAEAKAAEVDRAKELGDVLWYATALAHVVGYNLENLPQPPVPPGYQGARYLQRHTGSVADRVKKHVFHLNRTDADVDLLWDLASIMAALRHYAQVWCSGATLDDIRGLNVVKLRLRHPAGFDPGYHGKAEGSAT